MFRKLGYHRIKKTPTASRQEKNKLWNAINAADVEKVAKFVDKYGKDKESMRSPYQDSLLTHACNRVSSGMSEEKFARCKKIIGILLSSPVIDVNGTDYTEATMPPLTSAARNTYHGNTEILKLLLNDERVDKNIIFRGQTALYFAIEDGNAASVAALVSSEAVDVNLVTSKFGNTALHRASMLADVSITNILLDCKRINVNVRDTNGNTAAHIALENRKKLTARKIIQRPDFDTNSQGQNNETALIRAVIVKSIKTVDLLLSKQDIDINLATSTGHTPLICAVKSRHEIIFNKLMARPEIDIRAKDKKGSEALHYAVEKHNYHALQALLLRPEIDVNCRDCENVTPLFLAAAVNDIDAATLLLAAKNIDVNAVCDDGTSALAAAALHNNALLIRLLLKHGADPTHIDNFGRTARMIAADKMHFGIASLLADASDAWKRKSSTPLQKNSLLAKSRGDMSAAQTEESSPSPKL